MILISVLSEIFDEVSHLIPSSEMLFTNDNLSFLESESSSFLTFNV